MSRSPFLAVTLAGALLAGNAGADTVLLQEDFNGITGFSGGADPRIFGVPVTGPDTSATIVTADNNWYAARFEQPSDGTAIYTDVGAQFFGGGGNNTIVGVAEDDAGILIGVETTGYTNITLRFDWRTFSASGGDRVVVGYYVGDLLSVVGSHYDAATRSFDLRNAAHGGQDGVWNWNPQNAGATGDWVELLRGRPRDTFTTALFNLAGAGNGQVWLGFWLDNGEGDFAKLDNIVLTGVAIVPLPAALPLLFSGLALLGVSGRRRA